MDAIAPDTAALAADRRAVLAHLVEGSQDPGLLAELADLIRDSDQGSHGESRP